MRRRRRDGSHEGQHMPWTPSPAALPRNPSGSASRRPSPEESPAPFLTTVVIKVLSVVGILQDEVDPMVFVMKIEMTPLESCADIGGLDAQIQEIKEAVELPDLYEDIGFRHPKGVILYGEQGKIYL